MTYIQKKGFEQRHLSIYLFSGDDVSDEIL